MNKKSINYKSIKDEKGVCVWWPQDGPMATLMIYGNI